MLATTIADYPWDWEDNLRQLCYAHNTSVHSSTGHTPFFLMFSRQVRLLVDLAFKLPQTQPVYQAYIYTIPLEIPISNLEKNWDTICKDKRKYICLENSQISLKQRQCGLVIQSGCTGRTV